MHAHHQLRRAERPTFLQHQVVDVLQADPGELAEDIDFIQHFLQVDQADSNGRACCSIDLLKRVGGGAMPAARVEVDEVELLHSLMIVPRTAKNNILNGCFPLYHRTVLQRGLKQKHI